MIEKRNTVNKNNVKTVHDRNTLPTLRRRGQMETTTMSRSILRRVFPKMPRMMRMKMRRGEGVKGQAHSFYSQQE